MMLALCACLPATYAAAAGLPLPLTPAQTEGPYYPVTLPVDTDADLTRIGNGAPARGQALIIDGKLVDRDRQEIGDARVEIWQTDHQGIYMHPNEGRTAQRDMNFQFYGETRTGADGSFRFRTIVPAPYSGRPRHIHAKVTLPGGRTLTTQFYFAGDRELQRDGIVRRLGPALGSVTLAPQKNAEGVQAAAITIVMNR